MPAAFPSHSTMSPYLVLNDHGEFGVAYGETDPAKADRETIIRNFPHRSVWRGLRVVAFNTAEGRHGTARKNMTQTRAPPAAAQGAWSALQAFVQTWALQNQAPPPGLSAGQ
jgi:hypothetical protein